MNPQTSLQPTTPVPLPPKTPSTRLIISIVAAVFIVLVTLAAIGFALVKKEVTKSTYGGPPGNFQNWLKPVAEIKIGDNRYVSPCRALPLSSVESAFGPLTGKSLIQEKSLDYSVTESSSALQLSCNYNHVSGSGQDVNLSTEQYVDANDIKHIQTSLGSFEAEEVQKEISLYDKAMASTRSSNQGAKDFLTKLKQSFSNYKKYVGEYDEEKLTGLNVNDFILPISETLSGANDDFAFVGVHNNVVYTLGHTPTSRKGAEDLSRYSDKELVNELISMKQATDAVAKNLQNAQLDQSPAPTILGPTNKFGSTTILEPCAVMTPAVYAKIIGQAQNSPVNRTTVNKDITTKYHPRGSKQLILPHNDCTRQTRVAGEDFFSDANTYASFELEHGSSESQAKSWFAENYKVGSKDTVLQTNADWAVSFANTITPDTYDPVIVFRVGAYIGSINIYTSKDEADDVVASPDQYVQAINELTASLKQNITQIQ
ncbi:MAG: hypothetical protein JWN82_568 [Candidatus Saccharibacteria bacterium]|nr:hypothetical protein [Candidatus Saccharibacteria bacterium]